MTNFINELKMIYINQPKEDMDYPVITVFSDKKEEKVTSQVLLHMIVLLIKREYENWDNEEAWINLREMIDHTGLEWQVSLWWKKEEKPTEEQMERFAQEIMDTSQGEWIWMRTNGDPMEEMSEDNEQKDYVEEMDLEMWLLDSVPSDRD